MIRDLRPCSPFPCFMLQPAPYVFNELRAGSKCFSVLWVFLCEPLDWKWVEPFLAEDDRALAFQQKEIFPSNIPGPDILPHIWICPGPWTKQLFNHCRNLYFWYLSISLLLLFIQMCILRCVNICSPLFTYFQKIQMNAKETKHKSSVFFHHIIQCHSERCWDTWLFIVSEALLYSICLGSMTLNLKECNPHPE